MITSILSFFAFGTFAFWLLLLVCSIITVVALENDSQWFSTGATVVLIVLTLHSWPSMRWWMYLVAAVLYFAIGGAWSIFRWLQFVRNCCEKGGSRRRGDLEDYLVPSKHKQAIYGWITFWPWSFVWHVIGDIVKESFRKLVNCYNNITTRTLDRHFNKLAASQPSRAESRYRSPSD